MKFLRWHWNTRFLCAKVRSDARLATPESRTSRTDVTPGWKVQDDFTLPHDDAAHSAWTLYYIMNGEYAEKSNYGNLCVLYDLITSHSGQTILGTDHHPLCWTYSHPTHTAPNELMPVLKVQNRIHQAISPSYPSTVTATGRFAKS